jgi:hypothetical protein
VVADTVGVDIAGAMRMAIPPLLWKLPQGVVDATFDALARVSVTMRFFFVSAKEAFGVETPSEFLRVWEPYNLWSVQDRLRVPLLVVITEDEIAEAPTKMIEDTFEFLRRLEAPFAFRVFPRDAGGSAHCQVDSPERLPPVLFPWLNRAFSPGYPSGDEVVRNDAEFAKARALVEKHHGRRLASRPDFPAARP